MLALKCKDAGAAIGGPASGEESLGGVGTSEQVKVVARASGSGASVLGVARSHLSLVSTSFLSSIGRFM